MRGAKNIKYGNTTIATCMFGVTILKLSLLYCLRLSQELFKSSVVNSNHIKLTGNASGGKSCFNTARY